MSNPDGKKTDSPEEEDVYTRYNVYRPPAEKAEKKKHPCPDCSCCQFCSDSRCDECLKRTTCPKAAK